MFALYLFHQFKVGTALEIGNRVVHKIDKTHDAPATHSGLLFDLLEHWFK